MVSPFLTKRQQGHYFVIKITVEVLSVSEDCLVPYQTPPLLNSSRKEPAAFSLRNYHPMLSDTETLHKISSCFKQDCGKTTQRLQVMGSTYLVTSGQCSSFFAIIIHNHKFNILGNLLEYIHYLHANKLKIPCQLSCVNTLFRSSIADVLLPCPTDYFF